MAASIITPTAEQLQAVRDEAAQQHKDYYAMQKAYLASLKLKFPDFFKQVSNLAKSASLHKSDTRRYNKYWFWLSFDAMPEWNSGDPFHGKPSRQDILEVAAVAVSNQHNQATTSEALSA